MCKPRTLKQSVTTHTVRPTCTRVCQWLFALFYVLNHSERKAQTLHLLQKDKSSKQNQLKLWIFKVDIPLCDSMTTTRGSKHVTLINTKPSLLAVIIYIIMKLWNYTFYYLKLY